MKRPPRASSVAGSEVGPPFEDLDARPHREFVMRAFLLLRGMRGSQGVPWLVEQLKVAGFFSVLALPCVALIRRGICRV